MRWNTSKARERRKGRRAYCLAVPDKGLGVVCEVLDCVHGFLSACTGERAARFTRVALLVRVSGV